MHLDLRQKPGFALNTRLSRLFLQLYSARDVSQNLVLVQQSLQYTQLQVDVLLRQLTPCSHRQQPTAAGSSDDQVKVLMGANMEVESMS